MLYRGMDRATLDVAYNNTRAVAGFPAIFQEFQARSARFYETPGWQRDIRYGEHPRERFDLLPSHAGNAPTLIFIHGGYWQSLTKEDFSFVGEGAHKSGFNFLLAEYTLAPEFSMTQIVDQVGGLLDYIQANRRQLGLGNGPVCLSGHSAGGHLSIVHRTHPLLAHALAISPLVDLEPISLSYLNEKLKLTPAEIASYSPLRHIAKGAPLTVTVGAAELPELVRHSSDYADAASKAGAPVAYIPVEGANHFTVLDELALQSGMLMNALRQAIKS